MGLGEAVVSCVEKCEGHCSGAMRWEIGIWEAWGASGGALCVLCALGAGCPSWSAAVSMGLVNSGDGNWGGDGVLRLSDCSLRRGFLKWID